MYQFINGYTNKSMKERIKKYNNGTKAEFIDINGTTCQYLTKDGNRCSIGCFIPDNNKKALNHYGSVTDLLANFNHLSKHMPLSVKGLEKLQTIHDTFNANTNKFDTLHEALFEFIDTQCEIRGYYGHCN